MAEKKSVTQKAGRPMTKKRKCLICGKESVRLDGYFFMSASSDLYIQNDGYTLFCRKCVDKLFHEYKLKYDIKMACMIMCAKLDIPFYLSVLMSLKEKFEDENFMGLYSKQVSNLVQYKAKNFADSLVNGELTKNEKEVQIERDAKWTKTEIRNKNYIIDIIGHDPFDGYPNESRRFLFNQLLPYIEEDDDIADDPYKLSVILQIVDNNNQIRQNDKLINSLNPIKDASTIKDLINMKSSLSSMNDKMSKENEISVKNRSNKDAGKNSLTYLMRDLREKNFDRAEADYYDQLRGEGTRWANDISQKSMLEHCLFDENDKKEVYEEQLNLINSLYQKLDDVTEKNRLLTIEVDRYEAEFRDRGITFRNKDDIEMTDEDFELLGDDELQNDNIESSVD